MLQQVCRLAKEAGVTVSDHGGHTIHDLEHYSAKAG